MLLKAVSSDFPATVLSKALEAFFWFTHHNIAQSDFVTLTRDSTADSYH